MFQTHMTEVITKFNIATGIPISLYSAELELLDQRGLSKSDELSMEEFTMGKLSRLIGNGNHESYIPLDMKLYLVCVPVEGDKSNGYYALGPSTCSKGVYSWARYLPRALMPNLIALLRSFENDYSLTGVQRCQGFSLHVNRADHYISANYHEKITLDDISTYLGLDRTYFSSLYKKETGKSFTQSLNDHRIEKSKSLLLDGNSSIMDIALAVGFSNQNYFNSVFKSITGLTPSEFRNGN
ncbi:MAG TPA: AraC family transcriptional regulator [Tissierellaceae bacterium]|nr:AraC family transcriptional regulator [Tissierellaceae bacterium]